MDKIQIFGERKNEAGDVRSGRSWLSEKNGSGSGRERFQRGQSSGGSAGWAVGLSTAWRQAAARYLLAKAKTGWYFYRVFSGSQPVKFLSGARAEAGWMSDSG